MKKKVTACLTAVALASTVVASAAAMTACKSADLRILLLANNAEDAFYKEYFAKIEEEEGISIKYNGYEESSYYDKLSVEITQGKTPDIFYLRPNEILQFRDELQDVESYVTEQKGLGTSATVKFDDVRQNALDMYRYNEETKKLDTNGKLYAFPKDLSTQQYGYNRNILNQYATEITTTLGLTLPWDLGKEGKPAAYTWAEFQTICSYISSNMKDKEYIGCDVPDIEVVAKSMGGELLDLSTGTVTVTSTAVTAAVDYLASLCTTQAGYTKPAADKEKARYSDFTNGDVAFYSQCGTWESGDYNKAFNKDGAEGWGLMPTPVKDNDSRANWQGVIGSAGYVVSKYSKKPDLAKKVAASFLTTGNQTKMMAKGLCLPLLTSLEEAYLNPDNDLSEENPNGYSPTTRNVFMEVIKGTHGFIPVQYKTYDSAWLKILNTQLDSMSRAQIVASMTAEAYRNDTSKFDLATIQSNMQNEFNKSKDK